MNLLTNTQTGHRILAYVTALALLVASVAATRLPLSDVRIGIHLGSALLQAALLLTVFMQLQTASPLVRILALGAILWLAVMFGFFALDYLNR